MRAFPAAGSGEDTHALTLATGEQAIQDAHPQRHRSADNAAGQRVRRILANRIVIANFERTHAGHIQRFAHTAQHPAQQPVTDRRHVHAASRNHLGIGRYAIDFAHGRQQSILAGESFNAKSESALRSRHNSPTCTPGTTALIMVPVT
ncbi:MAG: hypothetical protein H6974_10705 [Gammaproteobacteria bacterium]|nr:hypothetical protein [Gammaproteobacteria bacterium]